MGTGVFQCRDSEMVCVLWVPACFNVEIVKWFVVSAGQKRFVFRLSRRQNCKNSFRADSHVNCLKTSNVSETHSVSILRETDYFA
jgi:hypothetical protein